MGFIVCEMLNQSSQEREKRGIPTTPSLLSLESGDTI